MDEPEIIPPRQPTSNRSWGQAYMAFLRSPRELRALKLMPLVLVGIVPVSALDDFVVPVLGVVDDIPTALLVVGTLVATFVRVRIYR